VDERGYESFDGQCDSGFFIEDLLQICFKIATCVYSHQAGITH
jgi:hypothetical protein